MCIRRPGIALILVLVAAASVFALAMQGAVSSQLGTVEAGSVLRQFDGELRARSAAAIVFKAVAGEAEAQAVVAGEPGAAPSSGGASPGAFDEEEIELPPFLRKMMEESGIDLQRAVQEALITESTQASLDGGGLGAAAPSRIDLSDELALAIPTAPVEIVVDGWRCRVTLTDGAGGLNINLAGEAQLLRYFRAMGIASPTGRALASQILDWRDDDEFTHERGAEREAYGRRGIVHRNGRLRSLAELEYLPAMTRGIFERIEDDLCLSGDGRVHLGSASRAVLVSADALSEDTIERLLASRTAGGFDEAAVKELIDFDDADLAERVRFKWSPVIRVQVEVTPPGAGPSDRATRLHYQGAAVLGDHGLRTLGLRARAQPRPTVNGVSEVEHAS